MSNVLPDAVRGRTLLLKPRGTLDKTLFRRDGQAHEQTGH
jgi:hypothetical protein